MCFLLNGYVFEAYLNRIFIYWGGVQTNIWRFNG